MFQVEAIEKSLNEGCEIRGFRSASGLRVVRIENQKGELVGYGEHPAIETAISHANQDILDGHLEYDEQYGKNGKYGHYLTGSTHSSTPLDNWVATGKKFNVVLRDDKFLATLEGYKHVQVPKEITSKVISTGIPQEWTDERGLVLVISKSYQIQGAVSTQKKDKNDERDGIMYYVTREGLGENFWSSLDSAFKAQFVENQKVA